MNWFNKLFHKHNYQPFLLDNGQLSKQYSKCTECGKIKETCKHQYTEPYDYYPTSIRYDELEEISHWNFTVKNVRRCVKCNKLESIYSHQW